MPAPRQNPLLRARVSDDGTRIEWPVVKDGKRFEVLKQFLKGQDIGITIGRWKRKRSLSQNAYYWGVIVAMIAEEAGYSTNEEAHQALAWHFLRKHEEGKLDTVRSTTDLTTSEAEEYFSKCRQLGAEMFGIYIPEPNEVTPE